MKKNEFILILILFISFIIFLLIRYSKVNYLFENIPSKKYNLVYLSGRPSLPNFSSFKCNNEKLWGGDVEAEYILDILEKDKFNIFNSKLSNLPSHIDVLIYSSNIYDVKQIKNIVEEKKPSVVFHLSDEWGTRPEYHEILKHIPLVYRQYKFKHYKNRKNIKTFPLGYHCWDKNYIKELSMIKKTYERKFIWCFMGSPKGERKIYTDYLKKKIEPYFNEKTKSGENTVIYNNSIFTICPRGNVNIECSRQYIASLNGSIPIIICPYQEYNFLYNSLPIKPPWVNVSSIQKCYLKIKYYLKNPDKLQRLQNNVINWNYRLKQEINKEITRVLVNSSH